MRRRLLTALALVAVNGGLLLTGSSSAQPPVQMPRAGSAPVYSGPGSVSPPGPGTVNLAPQGNTGPITTPSTSGAPLFSDTIVEGSAPVGGFIGPTGCSTCGSSGCATCGDGCCADGCFYARAEYLFWWIRPERVPVLLTAGTGGSNGALGAPGTITLIGQDTLAPEARSGGRFTVGYALGQMCAIEANYFFLSSRTTGATFGSDGSATSPVIARPFTDALTGLATAQSVNFPGVVAGGATVAADHRLQGTELNAIWHPISVGETRFELLAGLRYMQMNEGLAISEQLAIMTPLLGNGLFDLTDRFNTRNYFGGGNLGASVEWRHSALSVRLAGKVALGGTREVVTINGLNANSSSTGVTTFQPGGFLAQLSNSGRFERDQFSVVPEAGLTIGYQITGGLRATVAYSFVYWSDVLRPSEQIDTVLNATTLPLFGIGLPPGGPVRPATQLKDSDFWAQGISFGLEYRF